MELNLSKVRIYQAKECLTIYELASKSGLAKATITRILSGKKNPSVKSAGLLARALNVDITDILAD